ncbi:MAG: nucleotidyltransferase family protein [Oscillospiraceae bacterium]|nr:nucleotidyltransferase family protein [Oscillospiraceae bacterium]
MEITGIICEYNPLHLGHVRQLGLVRQENPDGGIVCLMSGNFVQRGEPALLDKALRAQAAVKCGADLVLELPLTYALSSAEGFAAGGVRILSPFCRRLSFGAETADRQALLSLAQGLLSSEFPEALRIQLDKGLSFPAARQQALQAMLCDASLLTAPNNILAVEYCKAILSQGSAMIPAPIQRTGDYHAPAADKNAPSATAVRLLMTQNAPWEEFVPVEAAEVFRGAPLHTLSAGEKAVLTRLRTMTDEDFEALPYGSEGLWRKLMHAARKHSRLHEIIDSVKSKRYTYTRINRMVLCAFLGLTQETLLSPAPYTRVLAFNDRGREILNTARQTGVFLNTGEASTDPYWQLEQRAGDLYGLFAPEPEPPGREKQNRVYYHHR